MGTKWTKEQQSAIDTRGCNLLVAAAAGSGKTAVLVERILKIISNEAKPVDIDRLLVVTFTSAAAAEMRERIGSAISRALDENPESKLLQRQLTLLNRSNITTIHSFCLEVIRNNFHRIDLDPGFRIADETEALLLKNEVLQDLFDNKYEEENNIDFLRLVDSFGGGRDDSKLLEIVMNLFDFSMSGPWPEKWLRESAENFSVDEDFEFGSTIWGKNLKKNLKIELEGTRDILLSGVKIAESSSGIEPYIETLKDDLGKIEGLIELAEDSWARLHSSFSTLKFATLKRVGKDADKEAQESVKNLRDEAKEKVKKLQQDIFFLTPEEMKEDLNYMYPVMRVLSELVIEFNENYRTRKKERGILDFNDLEHYCLEILTERDEKGEVSPSEVALEFRKKFEEVLVDEYQDSNNVQEVIINMVSRKLTDNPNVFMVGDVKQSIYRFRQAKPELFLEKYNTYSDEEGHQDRKIMLYKNFRSRKEVIDGVNFVFRTIMSVNIGELEYDEKEALNLGANYKENEDEAVITGGPVEIHIIEKASREDGEAEKDYGEGEETDSPEEEEELDKIQLEARLVARRIKDLMKPVDGKIFKVLDKETGEYRSVTFKDIVILMRATSNWAPVFVEELLGEGIPVYADAGTGYFQTVEVATIMSLLQIIDNPMQDIPLLAVLRSPIFAFTPEDLIQIRLVNKEKYLYEALREMTEPEENLNSEGREIPFELWVKVKDFLRKLEGWREKSLHMSIDEFIWYLYGDTGYYGFVAAMPGGAQRQANLRILFQRARQYEETSFKGVFNFVNFINKLRKNNGDMGSAKILGENEDVVRIMSIHKSKGLEFPVVILSGTAKNFNLRDMNRSILFHHDMGYGPDYVNIEKRTSYSTIYKEAIKKKIKLESLSEEMRILYVAFTRAKEKLIITGCVNDIEVAAVKWYYSAAQSNDPKIPEYEVIKGKSYLDWIASTIIRHQAGEELISLSGGSGLGIRKIEDLSTWKLQIWNKNRLTVDKIYESVDKIQEVEDGLFDLSQDDTIKVEPDTDKAEESYEKKLSFVDYLHIEEEGPYFKEIKRRLSWEYPLILASRIPTRISVSELKRRATEEMPDEEAAVTLFSTSIMKKPLFLEEAKGLSPTERGIAMHSVMQHLKLDKVSSADDIKEQINIMVIKEFITEEMAKAVNPRKIFKFFESDIGKRALMAFKNHKLYREVPFSVRIKAIDVDKDLPKGIYEKEEILLQGVIDCYFEEGEELILLDYKTDYVGEDGAEAIVRKYETQIRYYTEALERIRDKRVKGKYLYLFSSGEVVEVK